MTKILLSLLSLWLLTDVSCSHASHSLCTNSTGTLFYGDNNCYTSIKPKQPFCGLNPPPSSEHE